MTVRDDVPLQINVTGGDLDPATVARLREAISRYVTVPPRLPPLQLPPLPELPRLKVPPVGSITTRFPDGPGTVLGDLRRGMALIRQHMDPEALQPARRLSDGSPTHFAGVPVYTSRSLPADVVAVYSPDGIFVRDPFRDLALPLLADHVRRQAEDDLVAIAAAAERRLGLAPEPCPCGHVRPSGLGEVGEPGDCVEPARFGGPCAYCRRWCSA